MSLSYLPPSLATWFHCLASWLDKRTAVRVPALLVGVLLATGRLTVTAWIRAAGLSDDFRQTYATVCAIGRQADHLALTLTDVVQPLIPGNRLVVALDDTPTKRYGPDVEGAGLHHHPSPGPANEELLYGHVWVVLAALVRHPDEGARALPLQADLYIRAAQIPGLPPERKRPFRTKLELAAGQLQWLDPWVDRRFTERWVAVDGGYAKRPFLLPAQASGWAVFSRLRKDAHLNDVPPTQRRKGQRGPLPTYGKNRIHLAEEAASAEGWEQVECEQYGRKVTKTVKTFLATWRPAGGVIRVVIVKEEDGWVAFFATDPTASAADVLEVMADRGSLEQTNKDLKEVGGAGEQQVRNVHSSEGCFNLTGWMYSLVEAWAWDKEEEELVDRSASPWDRERRRPSHADKRRALRREILRAELQAVLSGDPTREGFRGEVRAVTDRILEMAA